MRSIRPRIAAGRMGPRTSAIRPLPARHDPLASAGPIRYNATGWCCIKRSTKPGLENARTCTMELFGHRPQGAFCTLPALKQDVQALMVFTVLP